MDGDPPRNAHAEHGQKWLLGCDEPGGRIGGAGGRVCAVQNVARLGVGGIKQALPEHLAVTGRNLAAAADRQEGRWQPQDLVDGAQRIGRAGGAEQAAPLADMLRGAAQPALGGILQIGWVHRLYHRYRLAVAEGWTCGQTEKAA